MYISITSRKPKAQYPLTLELTSPKMPKRSWVKISQIRALSVLRLGKRIGSAKPEEVSRIIEGLAEILDA